MATKQTASEKKLFAAVKELREQVDALQENVVNAIPRDKAAWRKMLLDLNLREPEKKVGIEAWGNGFIGTCKAREALKEFVGEGRQCKCNCCCKQTQPIDGHYGHLNVPQNDAEWQRVIKEKYLCEFNNSTISIMATIDTLHRRDGLMFLNDKERGRGYCLCNPLNKPGVMQPYFGRGMPVKGETKVLTKHREDGWRGQSRANARDWGWEKGEHSGGDIVAFIVLE